MAIKKASKKASKGAYITGIITLILVAILAQIRLDIPVETLSVGYTNEHSQFIDIDGVIVHYRDEGAGEPLILIHGVAASLHTWDAWADELKDDFRVIRMDLPGFGLTGPAVDGYHEYTLDYYAEFMEKFLSELNIEKAHFAGNSLGGGITWSIASHYPERVDSIILLNPVGYSLDGPSIMKLISTSPVHFIVRHFTPEFAVKLFVYRVYGDNSRIEEGITKRYHHLQLREGNRMSLMQVMDTLINRDYTHDGETISNIEVPSLIIWGERDLMIPVENAYRFDEGLPDSRLIVYEGVGHLPMEEIPHETAKDTREFLFSE